MDNVYQTIGDKTLIFTIYRGAPRAALIDSEDLGAVASVDGKWKIGQDNRFFLAERSGVEQQVIYMHDIIIGALAPGNRTRRVAHINGDGADNRKGNLMFLKD